MTRKKSNVKALALAVTCAILAGGGVGLTPVYAAPEVGRTPTTGDVTYDSISTELKYASSYDIRELTVHGVTIGDQGGISGRIIAKEIVGGTIESIRQGLKPSDISINGAKFADGGAITATGLKLRDSEGNDYDVRSNIEAIKGDLQTNNNNYNNLSSTVNSHNVDITNLKTTVGDDSSGLVKEVNGLKEKTTKFNNDGTTLTGMEEVGANKVSATKLAVGGKEINADTVAGYDAAVSKTANITYDATHNVTYINEGTAQQVVIDEKGLKVGKNSSRMNDDTGFATSKNLYVGTADAENPTAANSKFYVNGATGETVVNGTDGKTTVYGGSITIDSAVGNQHVLINSGTVNASASVVSPDFFVDPNNDFKKNSLKVGDGTKGVTIEDGAITTTGDATVGGTLGVTGGTTVGGDLTVAGTATFAKETTFGQGIKTDTISEKTPNAGVTVDGNLHANKNAFVEGKLTVDGDIEGKGALKGKTLGIGTDNDKFTVAENGNTNVGGTLGVTGATTLENTLNVKGATTLDSTLAVASNTTVGGTLGVIGKTTLSNELQVDGKATFGNATGSHTVIEGGNITADGKLTSQSAKIGHVGIDNTGEITGVTSLTTNALTVNGGFTTDGPLTVHGDLNASGAINGNTISINNGGSIAGVNFATGGNLTATTGTIGDVSFATGGNVSGISELTATTIKDGAGTIITGGNVEAKTAKIGAINIDNETIKGSSAHGLSIEGVKIKDGVVSDVTSLTANSATIGGVNTLDNKGLTVKTGSKVQVGTNTVIEDGSVKVSQKTSLTDQSLQLNDTNKWTQEGGLVADKATVNGVVLGDAQGKATFTDAEGTTTIAGKNITTGKIIADELLIDRISLGKNGNNNISIDDSGNVTTKGDITITDATNAVLSKLSQDKATFGKDEANQTVIENGKLKAQAKNNAGQQAKLEFDESGFAVSGQNKEGKTSAFGFNTEKGIGTFKGLDQTTTTVNGSVITSIKSTTDTGVLNGSNLTLVNGDNKTELTAGGVTFTGKKGFSTKHGNETTIDGGVITTDTLKVRRIQLGEKIVDERTGEEIGSGVTLASDGGFTAAGGNFKVTGGTTGSRGSITNVVGDDDNGKTSFTTDQQGAKMSFKKGDVTSNVSVADGSANVSAGAGSIDVTNDSITSKVTDNATSTITKDSIVDKVGNNSVTTDDKGTTFANGGTKTTNINGGTITTGKLITDELVITGKGDAAGPGTGSLAFGGNGTIKSDVKEDGSTNNTQFTTDINGVNTMVTDGKITATTTENKVTAEGNSNTVTKGDDQKSEFNQGLTSIGGVVTNGKINVAQYLDGETGLLTNEVKDANGSSKLEQSSTGLTYTDSAKPDNATRINSSDVSIGSATNDKDRINLSDLGQIDELDQEIRDNEVYKKNETAVGGINAEAGIRREEVARLDGRINDVNDRVNKVGAMAAAIASLKSIGYDPQAPSEFSIGLGQYKGETGVAMGFFHYPNKNFMINVSLSTAGGETMGGIGATWRFGHKSPQKLLEEQREAQAKKELAAAEKYQAAAKLAKEAQERAEYAAKLARQAQVSADNAKAAADATQAKHFG